MFLLRIGDARHGCAACEGESTRGDVERTGRTSRQLEQIRPDHHLTEVEFVSTNPNRTQHGLPSPSPLHKSRRSEIARAKTQPCVDLLRAPGRAAVRGWCAGPGGSSAYC